MPDDFLENAVYLILVVSPVGYFMWSFRSLWGKVDKTVNDLGEATERISKLESEMENVLTEEKVEHIVIKHIEPIRDNNKELKEDLKNITEIVTDIRIALGPRKSS